MAKSIRVKKSLYADAHQANLTSARMIPQEPYTRQDIHDAFEQVRVTLCELRKDMDQRLIMDHNQFDHMDFKWLIPKRKHKRFVPKNRPHRLKHQHGSVYTVAELIDMIQSKVYHTQKHNKRLLEDFTESMLMRTNLSLKWFDALVKHYYKGDLRQQQLWQHRLKQVKIKIDWV